MCMESSYWRNPTHHRQSTPTTFPEHQPDVSRHHSLGQLAYNSSQPKFDRLFQFPLLMCVWKANILIFYHRSEFLSRWAQLRNQCLANSALFENLEDKSSNQLHQRSGGTYAFISNNFTQCHFIQTYSSTSDLYTSFCIRLTPRLNSSSRLW